MDSVPATPAELRFADDVLPTDRGALSSTAFDMWDRRACDAFVDVHYERLFAWLCWLTGRRDWAADLTQESFAEFWESLARKPIREPVAWLFRIARNRWRKACRGGGFRATGEAGLYLAPDSGARPD